MKNFSYYEIMNRRKAQRHLERASELMYGSSVPPGHGFGGWREWLGRPAPAPAPAPAPDPELIVEQEATITWNVGSEENEEWVPLTVPEIMNTLRRVSVSTLLAGVSNMALDMDIYWPIQLRHAMICEELWQMSRHLQSHLKEFNERNEYPTFHYDPKHHDYNQTVIGSGTYKSLQQLDRRNPDLPAEVLGDLLREINRLLYSILSVPSRLDTLTFLARNAIQDEGPRFMSIATRFHPLI